MLTRVSTRRRSGVTLLELLVVLAIAGIALALIAAISLRQQRALADLADASALSEQMQDAVAILPIDLRGVGGGPGDIREARDTAIEIRGTIASAVGCDTAHGSLVLAPATDGASTFGSVLRPIEAGDTAWVYAAADSEPAWIPYRVSGVLAAAPGPCLLEGPLLQSSARVLPRIAVTLDGLISSSAIGAPIRFTRPLRYSLYRASDGKWYLGERDWNNTNAHFNTIQPVSGPFLAPADGGMALHYFDGAGTELPSPVTDPRTIATVRTDLAGQPRRAVRILSAAAGSRGVESVSVVVLLHNRR
jgi:prepilin-type N-terminal cleavage/methylation domain-containing protein